jgi:hypothetical protein
MQELDAALAVLQITTAIGVACDIERRQGAGERKERVALDLGASKSERF